MSQAFKQSIICENNWPEVGEMSDFVQQVSMQHAVGWKTKAVSFETRHFAQSCEIIFRKSQKISTWSD